MYRLSSIFINAINPGLVTVLRGIISLALNLVIAQMIPPCRFELGSYGVTLANISSVIPVLRYLACLAHWCSAVWPYNCHTFICGIFFLIAGTSL